MNNPTICPQCFQPNEAARTYCWKCSRSLEIPATVQDYLQFLALKPSFEMSDLKQAYHALATKYHPDKNPGNWEAEAFFKFVNQADEALSNSYSNRHRPDKPSAPDNASSSHGADAEIKPETAEIIDKIFASFQSQLYSRQKQSRAWRIFHHVLVGGASLTAVGDLIYGIHLYQKTLASGLTSDYSNSLWLILCLLGFAIALIALSDQLPPFDVMPYSSTFVDLNPKVYTFFGWLLLWVLLLSVIPTILENALVRR